MITAVFRTQDFFKDDPNSVANLKRKHAEEITKIQKEKTDTESGLRAEIVGLKSSHAAEIKNSKDEYMMSLAKASRRPTQVINPIPQ